MYRETLYLGAPTRVLTRRGGGAWEGTQPGGAVEVFSAKATEQAIRGASEDVDVLPGEGFFRRVAEEAGVEVRDASAERLLALLPEPRSEARAASSTPSPRRRPPRSTSCASILGWVVVPGRGLS